MAWRLTAARLLTVLFVLLSTAAPACNTACALRSQGVAHCAAAAPRPGVHAAADHGCMGGMHPDRAPDAPPLRAARCLHSGCGQDTPALLKSTHDWHAPQPATLCSALSGDRGVAGPAPRFSADAVRLRSSPGNAVGSVLRI